MTRTKFGRTRSMVVANLAVIVLIAGCGGSTVDATGTSGATAVQPESATGADAKSGVVPAPDIAAADPGAAAASPGAAAATSTVEDSGAATKTAKAAKAGKNDKATAEGAGGSSSGGQLAGAGLAAERMVANAAIFGGKAPCSPATLSEVNIGNVSTLSGVLGELFSPVKSALSTFVASQNACGGLNGHKIKYFQDDDQGDPSTAVAKIQSMIQTKNIIAFVGNIQVLTVDAIAPIIKKAGIPIIGSDLTSNTWFTNPLMFPQGSPPQAVGYGFSLAARDYFKKPVLGTMYCLEVPRACENFNLAAKELAPTMGVEFKKDFQVSITAPSYVQQCLEMKNAGVQTLGLLIDAASQNRIARSCEQVGYHPNVVTAPISVGNEKQYLTGKSWLGNVYIPMNSFPWMGNTTAAEKYWQASVKKYNPGFASGGAASLGWAAGALLVAASAGLSETNPSTQQLLDTLYTFKGQKFTQLGGLAGPRTFGEGANPKVPYCLYTAITNDAGTGWKSVVSKPNCTDKLSPSDPQNAR